MSDIKESVDKIDLNLKYAFENDINIKARVIQLIGEIDEEKFKLIDIGITELERHNQKAITIRINSDGGSVTDALAIIGRIKTSKCRVVTEAYGACQSAATLILAAGHKRKASEYLIFMHHEASYDVEGRHSNIRAEVLEMERQEKLWAEWMAKFSKKDLNFYLKEGVSVDAYWTPAQLLEYGIIDEVI